MHTFIHLHVMMGRCLLHLSTFRDVPLTVQVIYCNIATEYNNERYSSLCKLAHAPERTEYRYSAGA
jgi:hypothetical protein